MKRRANTAGMPIGGEILKHIGVAARIGAYLSCTAQSVHGVRQKASTGGSVIYNQLLDRASVSSNRGSPPGLYILSIYAARLHEHNLPGTKTLNWGKNLLTNKTWNEIDFLLSAQTNINQSNKFHFITSITKH